MKYIITVILSLAIIATAFLLYVKKEKKEKKENNKMGEILVKQVQPEDEELLEEWIRETEDNDILGVSASRSGGEWPWNVFICVAEFIRTEPLESELQKSIHNALMSVPGVTGVVHEDREVWLVQGSPKGADLVRACSAVVDRLSSSTRKVVNEL